MIGPAETMLILLTAVADTSHTNICIVGSGIFESIWFLLNDAQKPHLILYLFDTNDRMENVMRIRTTTLFPLIFFFLSVFPMS